MVNISDSRQAPFSHTLAQNYPNPFNPSTTIEYEIAASRIVKLDIFNILGQKIKRLVNQEQPAGTYKVIWDGTNENGHPVSSGVYYYRLIAGKEMQMRKMILMH